MAIVLCDDEHEKNTILDRKKLIVAKKTAYDKKQGNMYGGLLGKGFYADKPDVTEEQLEEARKKKIEEDKKKLDLKMKIREMNRLKDMGADGPSYGEDFGADKDVQFYEKRGFLRSGYDFIRLKCCGNRRKDSGELFVKKTN